MLSRSSSLRVGSLRRGAHSIRSAARSAPAVALPSINRNHNYPSTAHTLRHTVRSFSTDAKVSPSSLSSSNPLLSSNPLPLFSVVTPEHVSELTTFFRECSETFDEIEKDIASNIASNTPNTYSGVIHRLESLTDRISFVYGTVSHLAAVKDSTPLRAAVQEIEPHRLNLVLKMGQSKVVYDALTSLSGQSGLTAVQKKIISDLLLESRLAGVGLTGDDKARFNEYSQRLSNLSTSFNHNVLDANKSFGLTITNPEVMNGLPDSVRDLYAQHARNSEPKILCATKENGPWRVGLSAAHLMPFLTHCRSRGHREVLHRAYLTRASQYDGFDNTSIVSEILLLRHAISNLLGFPSYAHQSLATKMVSDPNEVHQFLEQLRSEGISSARSDLVELQEFAWNEGLPRSSTLKAFDVAFYADKLAKKKLSFDSEALRPYLPFDKVLTGVWQLVEQLFGVRIKERDPTQVGPGKTIDTWHPDVKYFDVYRLEGGEEKLIAGFYVDAYSRPHEKRGGAWMGECVGRAVAPNGDVRLPVAFLICNQQPPTSADRPSLMSFDELTTLKHEFGHVSQHIFTTVNESSVAGIRGVEWDAVELASQFLENFAYEPSILKSLTKHVDSGEELPQPLIDSLLAARTFRAGSALLRQVHFATVDMELHHRAVKAAFPTAMTIEPTPANIATLRPHIRNVEQSVAQKCSVMPFDPTSCFLNSFAHIWAGGYAAGYYSYKWAETMSCDAFEAFSEVVADNPPAAERTRRWASLGTKYRDTVLALGGSVKAKEVFRMFRGRDPSITPMLKQAGLVKQNK